MCFSSFQGKEEGIIVTLDEEARLSFAARPPNLDRDLNVFSPNFAWDWLQGLPANLYNLQIFT